MNTDGKPRLPPAGEVIRDVRTSVYAFPTEHGPHADGTLTWHETVAVVVELDAGDQHGLGWTYSHHGAAAIINGVLAPAIRDHPVSDHEAGWRRMVDAIRNLGRPGICSQAIAAVDIAWWDLRARSAEQPLHVLLGAPRDARVPVYGSGGFTNLDDEALDAQLAHWRDLGCQAVKIKVGESWGARAERDLQRTEHVRDVCGSDVVVMVDANGGYAPAQARQMLQRFDDLGVSWFEEPVSSDDLDELAALRGHGTCGIAAGEYADSIVYAARMLRADAVDCLQLDVTRCASITEWRRCAALADTPGVPVSGHCAPALHAAVAAATPHLRHVELFRDHELLEPLLVDAAPVVAHGQLVLTEALGHGMSLAPTAGRFRVD